MALIVQKYGGTSVGDIERIQFVADKISELRKNGHALVVVVSAMSGETDRLVSLAQKLSNQPDPREVDVLLATGEQVSIALLSMALIDRGCPARSYTGPQVHIRTDAVHNKAKILGIDGSKIRQDLESGKVVVVAGFQGMDTQGNITTLGRGGSDTTAVALAAALNADECQIYTDVDGVYTADPKMVKEARRMTQITFEEMLELSSQGAKVMQIRAVEFAGKYNVPVRVLSSFQEGPGTLITKQEAHFVPELGIKGIAYNREEARLHIHNIPNTPGIVGHIMQALAQAYIEVDMILQSPEKDDKLQVTFTLHRRDVKQAQSIIHDLWPQLKPTFSVNDKVSKISLVGFGLRSQANMVGEILTVLDKVGIYIQQIASSEIKISLIVDEQHLSAGMNLLHQCFLTSHTTN